MSLTSKLQKIFSEYRKNLLPGISITGVIILLRLLGGLQTLEWMAFDKMLRHRPGEEIDKKITIVGIDDTDIKRIGKYPVPDKNISLLIEEISSYEPRVIGLNIFRYVPVEPGHKELTNTLEKTNNLIGINQPFGWHGALTLPAPLGLPQERVGFSDIIFDSDGFVRRGLLGAHTEKGDYQFSLSIRLAEKYLSSEGLSLENGINDPVAMRFGKTELHRFRPNSGGYIREYANDNQILINYRNSKKPFQLVSYSQIIDRKVDPEWLKDRIIIIGLTSTGSGGVARSNAIRENSFGVVNGLIIQSHIVSQIINSALLNRPLIYPISDFLEYFLIISCGFIGIVIAQISRNPMQHILFLLAACLALFLTSYLIIILLGWWLPVVPGFMVLTINGLYLYDRTLRLRAKERQVIVDRVFDLMHSGPLQLLANILRNEKEEDWEYKVLHPKLEHLNQEIRNVYRLAGIESEKLDLGILSDSKHSFNLDRPLHKTFYDIYRVTIEREMPYFKDIGIKIIKFEPLNIRNLNLDHKRDLCKFLEESLINISKHAVGVTEIKVMCFHKNGYNTIQIMDNGTNNKNNKREGFGTLQAKRLATRLHGELSQCFNTPHGFVRELTWPAMKTL